MDRNHLEDRIRASLKARAGDVQPTPALWQRVSGNLARRRRWQGFVWALGGAAAVVALVVGIPAILPDGSIRIVDQDPADQPPPGVGHVVVVTTDGSSLFEVDPTTGQVMNELPAFEGFDEPGIVGDVAVRPGTGSALVLASALGLEGMSWEVEVSVFDRDRSRIDRHRVTSPDWVVPATHGLGPMFSGVRYEPTLAWSPDGRWLTWVRLDVESGDQQILALDWDAVVEAGGDVAPVELASAPGTDDPLRMQAVRLGDDNVIDLWMTRTGGGDVLLRTCVPGTTCPADTGFQYDAIGMEGGVVIDLAFHHTGTTLALVAGPGGPQDAETSLQLVTDPMSGAQHALAVPNGVLPDFTASPVDGWIAAAGDRVAIGHARPALLTVTGDVAEDLEVVDSVDLPDGTRVADVAVTAAARPGIGAPSPAPTQGEPTDEPTEELPGEPMEVVAGEVHVAGVEHDDVLNVRSGPGVEFVEVAELAPTGTAVATGRGRHLGGTAGFWWELEVDGVTGWANAVYLVYAAQTVDLTAQVVDANGGERPSAATMEDLGLLVADLLAGGEEGFRATITVAPTTGDLGEVTVDVLGLGDDSVAGWRLHVFGTPDEDGFVLHSVEATTFCWRGTTTVDDGTLACV